MLTLFYKQMQHGFFIIKIKEIFKMSQNLTLVERAQMAASAAISSAIKISADKDYISGIYQQIQSYKIPSINTSKEAIRQAIINKGQDCPTSVPFSGYADLINNIQIGINTSDANATALDILNNRTAYVNGSMITGSRPTERVMLY